MGKFYRKYITRSSLFDYERSVIDFGLLIQLTHVKCSSYKEGIKR